MSLSTSNKFGKISISEDAMQTVASHAAQECYGVVDLVSRRFSDNFSQIFGKEQLGKGAIVQTVDNLIYVELFVILKVGINIEAVKNHSPTRSSFRLKRSRECV
ncbi:MAG: Asp23/Gls24 family envelope stress response protein [Christensenella sp.]|nr:MAG: Asp23/Gls24 family envelope stress response protein [Christensenella sp.]